MNHLRQLDIVDPKLLEREIHIIGCGSVGSWTALTLAKTGANSLVLWDFDNVESHNIPNQVYRPSDVGRPKTEALAEIVELMTETTPVVYGKATGSSEFAGIVIFAVDSMTVRTRLWRHIRSQFNVEYLIDSRMGAEVARIFVVKVRSPGDQKSYGATLYQSEDALDEPCTAKSTAYCATGMAAYITAKVVKLVTHRKFSSELAIDFRNALVLQSQQVVDF